MTKKYPSAAVSIRSLIQQVQNIHQLTQTLPYSGRDHTQQAERLLAEMQRILNLNDDPLIEKLFSASIAPQLSELACKLKYFEQLTCSTRYISYPTHQKTKDSNTQHHSSFSASIFTLPLGLLTVPQRRIIVKFIDLNAHKSQN